MVEAFLYWLAGWEDEEEKKRRRNMNMWCYKRNRQYRRKKGQKRENKRQKRKTANKAGRAMCLRGSTAVDKMESIRLGGEESKREIA